MGKRRRRKPLSPRRWRMRRPRRLQSAPAFLATYSGKNLVRGYARWFGVDLVCAVIELQLLGIDLDPIYVERLRVSARERELHGRERNEQRRRAALAAVEPLPDPEAEPSDPEDEALVDEVVFFSRLRWFDPEADPTSLPF